MELMTEKDREKMPVTTSIPRFLWQKAKDNNWKWNYLLAVGIRMQSENPTKYVPEINEFPEEKDEKVLKLRRKLEEISQKYLDLLANLRDRNIEIGANWRQNEREGGV